MLDFSVTFIFTVINIVILFLLLRVILFKPVTKFMADRAQRIQDTISQAAQEKAEAKKLLEQYERKLNDAEAEAEEIIKAAHENATLEAERIIAEGKAGAEAITASARRQLEAEQQAAFARFRLEAAALVMAASARLVRRELSGEDNHQYVNMLLDELSARKG